MKKRLSALLLALAMILALTACGNTEESAEDEETPIQEETVQPEDESTGGEEADADGEEPADEAPAEEVDTASNPGTGSAKPKSWFRFSTRKPLYLKVHSSPRFIASERARAAFAGQRPR